MQALILAAGMGKRLKEYTSNNTKCMVRVSGKTLIERALEQIDARGFSRVVMVVGYKGRELKEFIESVNPSTPVVFVENPIYDKTNNIYSLYLAKDYLCEDDTLLLESDIIFEPAVLDALLDDPRESLVLVDKYESWMDGTCLKLGKDDSISAFVDGKALDYSERESYYKTVNIYKFSKDFSSNRYVPFLEAYSKAIGNNEYYEQVLKVLAVLKDPGIFAKRLTGQKWYEIDDAQDLDIATSLFALASEKLELMKKRYGGYWRYPKLKDFCYLVNPFFPPLKMQEEMKAAYTELITSYPSGMDVISRLVAKDFGLDHRFVAVGNGAAELIKSICEGLTGRVGIIRPSFEEYSHRLGHAELVVYTSKKPDLSYSADDLISFFDTDKPDHLVLINPDNPSGNYIGFKDVLRIFEWAKERGIGVIYDESFSDFAVDECNTVLSNDILMRFSNVCVVKSLSKSYGIPGLRLGIAAGSDESVLSHLKKDVAIWNINSFAEYFLQIFGKYEKDYKRSTEMLKKERDRFELELRKIEGLNVIHSNANYIMVFLNKEPGAGKVSEILLEQYGILVKDLKEKTGRESLRIAVRDSEDNDVLLDALRKIYMSQGSKN